MDISLLRERSEAASFTVSELNNYIKSVFEENRTLSSVTVRGEISNFTNHRSGHLYFSLKDAEGQIRAVMFRTRAGGLKFMPESGMKVVVSGSVTVYPRDGSYQIYVSNMQPDGIGALYLAYEQLKERLSSEGLFDAGHKKEIPYYPERVGVITSPTGAAVRDIINVIGRRFPLAKVYLYPALVQGEGAPRSLVRALDYLDKSGLCDVIIIGRGGGSIEDLWAFNDEALARRIYEASVPIISAVGHETDFTICDFVSDLRAPTPSAAAELAVPDVRDLLMRTDALARRAESALIRKYERAGEALSRLSELLSVVGVSRQIENRRDLILDYRARAQYAANSIITAERTRLSVAAEKLTVINPLSVLSRGYSIAEGKRGIISSVRQVSPLENISLTLSDGVLSVRVNSVAEKKGENSNE